MPRKPKTRNLIETNLGQHIALSVAAHLACSQLVPNSLANSDGRELLDIVGGALLNVAPLYIRGGNTLDSRELTPAEMEGAAIREGAAVIVLKDGRRLGSVTMKRGDLRQAIAILKAAGIAGLPIPPVHGQNHQQQNAPAIARLQELQTQLAEIESLLDIPFLPAPLVQAEKLAISLARNAPVGHIANLAMRLIDAMQEARKGRKENLPATLALLRAAIDAQYDKNE